MFKISEESTDEISLEISPRSMMGWDEEIRGWDEANEMRVCMKPCQEVSNSSMELKDACTQGFLIC